MNDQPKKNGASQVLLQLANSPDKLVQLGTLALVAVSGITSTVQSNQLSAGQIEARDTAVRQISLLYHKVDDFEQRQLKMLQNGQDIIESNSKQLSNQTRMLEDEQTILKLLREERSIEINRLLNDVNDIKKKLEIPDEK